MAQVHNRHDREPLHESRDLVEEGPVVSVGTAIDEVERGAIAQVAQTEVLNELEIGAPVAIMTAGGHFVHAPPTALDRWVAALDSGREHEAVGGWRGRLAMLGGELALRHEQPRRMTNPETYRMSIEQAQDRAPEDVADCDRRRLVCPAA